MLEFVEECFSVDIEWLSRSEFFMGFDCTSDDFSTDFCEGWIKIREWGRSSTSRRVIIPVHIKEPPTSKNGIDLSSILFRLKVYLS